MFHRNPFNSFVAFLFSWSFFLGYPFSLVNALPLNPNFHMVIFVRKPSLGYNFGCNICWFCSSADHHGSYFLFKKKSSEKEAR